MVKLKRRNDRASEHDLQLPQRPRLAERWRRADPQEDSASDAEHAQGGQQRGRVD
jgi:hypothetical protein